MSIFSRYADPKKTTILIMSLSLGLTACGNDKLALGSVSSAGSLGAGQVAPVSLPVTAGSPGQTQSTPPGAPVSKNPLGLPSCVTTDLNHQCIGLKIESYENSSGVLLPEADASTLVIGMNSIWSTCNIGFQLEKYESVDPTTRGLAFNSDWQNDGSQVRSAFAESDKFLVVVVGALTGSTIAVTEMPGGGPYGTLVESLFARNPMTVGHELGHYMGLYHVTDDTNLMNPYIGPNTSSLTSSQCQTARATNTANWPQMMRN